MLCIANNLCFDVRTYIRTHMLKAIQLYFKWNCSSLMVKDIMLSCKILRGQFYLVRNLIIVKIQSEDMSKKNDNISILETLIKSGVVFKIPRFQYYWTTKHFFACFKRKNWCDHAFAIQNRGNRYSYKRNNHAQKWFV